ncbi:MAG: hypothetical protein JRJ79_00470 [Deltaproteobacteria bacterium]|nr:hypothetical protein [Deltaproteobacteria bacterium]MBW1792842.1 hypothetical protein [Deltaproteobacteria bacterium]
MASDINNKRPQNLLLVALLIIITLFTAFHEGYLLSISALFWGSLIAGFSISAWLALSISTRRLLSLMLGIFIIEYVKEAIGIRSRLWTYHGVGGHFNFGVWAWVLGGLVTYTLSIRVVIRLIRKLKLSLPGWLNPVILILISSLIPLTLGDYWIGAGGFFWSFYALLLIAGIYTSVRMEFAVFAGIVITAWIISNPSEYLGSVSSGVWTFTHNPDYPPFFLLFGCWPLEILAQYSLSAFLANEPLDKDTF